MSLPFTESNLDQMAQKAEEVSMQYGIQCVFWPLYVTILKNETNPKYTY